MRHLWAPAALIAGSVLNTPPSFATDAINLRHKPTSILEEFITAQSQSGILGSKTQIKPTSFELDNKGTLHLRVKQFYQGYPVWGADAVIHIPGSTSIDKDKLVLKNLMAHLTDNATMNGIIYSKIDKDLSQEPSHFFAKEQAKKALQQAQKLYQKQTGEKPSIKNAKTELIVYVDKATKAHWSYRVAFKVAPKNKMPKMPNYILDANTLVSYQQWDNIQTLDLVEGGGMGGNESMGQILYDGLSDKQLTFRRDANTNTCYLANSDVTVSDVRFSTDNRPMSFVCDFRNPDHGKVYWNGFDPINGAYSPSNDALYTGQLVKNMYKLWYGIPVLVKNNADMMLQMNVHMDMENAYWDGSSMTFGDGGRYFYPLVSLGVAGHEISHGFTEQHSSLIYYGESGGLNESFSDMAAQAVEFFQQGHNSWQIGPEIFKTPGLALRYMDHPSKDCDKRNGPGDYCSIDAVDQYYDGLDVHYSSGVFNHLFYYMGTSQGWDTKKAFNVMVKANRNYWTSASSFQESACGVLAATRDLGYRVSDVVMALKKVGFSDNNATMPFDIGNCE